MNNHMVLHAVTTHSDILLNILCSKAVPRRTSTITIFLNVLDLSFQAH